MTHVNFASITTKAVVSKADVQNLLVGVFEYGFSSWLRSIKSKNFAPGLTFTDFREGGKMQDPENYFHWSQIIPVTEGCSLTLIIDEPENDGDTREFILDCDAVRKGLQVMADKHNFHWSDFINGNDDAVTADVFGQCIVYGEIIYG